MEPRNLTKSALKYSIVFMSSGKSFGIPQVIILAVSLSSLLIESFKTRIRIVKVCERRYIRFTANLRLRSYREMVQAHRETQ